MFDCAHLSDEYDCGCGDEPLKNTTTPSIPDPGPMDLEDDFTKDDVTGAGLIKGGR
jgi:FAD-linked sulfhydryl oxidase